MAGKKAKRPWLKIEEIEAALRESRGIMTAASEVLGVSRSTVSERVRRSERLRKVIDEQRETVGDICESKLFKQIKADNLTAIIFYLKTIGRDRGYIERQEMNANVNLTQDDWVKKMEAIESNGSKKKTKAKK